MTPDSQRGRSFPSSLAMCSTFRSRSAGHAPLIVHRTPVREVYQFKLSVVYLDEALILTRRKFRRDRRPRAVATLGRVLLRTEQEERDPARLDRTNHLIFSIKC